jgi:hypothetical protein
VPGASLVILFAHPRLVVQVPGDAPVVCCCSARFAHAFREDGHERLPSTWSVTMRNIAALVTTAVAAAACSILDPTFEAPATIIFGNDTAQITAPESVARGVPFDVTVRTFGGGCTRTTAQTRQAVSTGLVEVYPYNQTRRSDVCTSDLRFLTHTVTLQFADPGAVTIRIIGQQGWSLSGGDSNRPAQLERIVTVQ